MDQVNTSSLDLPGVLAEIAAVAGEAAAVAVARAKGGTRAYLPGPDRLLPGHWLVATVGMEAAQAIAARLGGGDVEIPLGPYAGNRARVHAAIREAARRGESEAAIARLVGVTDRTVRNLKAARRDRKGLRSDQTTLF